MKYAQYNYGTDRISVSPANSSAIVSSMGSPFTLMYGSRQRVINLRGSCTSKLN